MDYKLPYPTSEELTTTTKHKYFARVLPMDLEKKYKITEQEYTAWISNNFSSIFLNNKELTFREFKKLTK